ncbi:MAG: sugar nucleotide-binding protein [Pseudomonadota bacterium]
MRLLLLGATGLAGQAFHHVAQERGFDVRSVARTGADIACDISDAASLQDILSVEQPDAVVNAVALVNLAACDAEPGQAWAVNARPAALLANWSQKTGQPFLHVSTDHFFAGSAPRAHSETAQVTLVNEYARSKFAGEAMALTSPHALALRTSIVGIRAWQAPSFAEWAIQAVRADEEMTLFRDAWTSSIDTPSFASAALDLLFNHNIRGLVNLAAAEVYSKEDFIREIALQLGCTLSRATSGSVHDVLPRRASSLGLDVSYAQKILPYDLPVLSQVVAKIIKQAGL